MRIRCLKQSIYNLTKHESPKLFKLFRIALIFNIFILGLVVNIPNGYCKRVGLSLPQRLTAGASDQYRGEADKNGNILYYLSNKNSTSEIYKQDLRTGGLNILFDHAADVNFPRISPDGTKLLFISYKKDAVGDVCIRDLLNESTKCITDGNSSESFAFWFPNGKKIGFTSKKKIHDNFMLFEFNLEDNTKRIILDKNVSNPAISPDGKWITYVPLKKISKEVGISFYSSVYNKINLYNLKTKKTVSTKMPLPGNSGFPAFSKDGKYIYFSQYLNDTNLDGKIDGNDHSVLFRLQFNSNKATLSTQPEQLTSARWNCQFPFTSSSKLFITCSFEGSLDIYSIPLDGTIPDNWDVKKLYEELDASRNNWDKLLIYSRILLFEKSNENITKIYRNMSFLHLKLKEYKSVLFYTKQVQELSAKNSFEQQWANTVLELVKFRENESSLQRGWIDDKFIQTQKKRISILEQDIKQYF